MYNKKATHKPIIKTLGMEPGQQNRFLDAFVATLLLNVLLFILRYVTVTVQVK